MTDRGPVRRYLLLLFVLAAFTYLVGNASVALWDRDEPRYAQCSREMLQGSPEHPGPDFVVPRFLGEPRYAKPPLIYWLQAGSMAVFGDNAFAARFPSTIAMLIVLAIVYSFTKRVTGGDDEMAFWTVFVLATSALAIVAAKASLTDATLLVLITIAHACAYTIWRGGGSWGVWATAGVATGLAALTKGPVVLGMIAATAVALVLMWLFDKWRDRSNKTASPGAEREPVDARDVALILFKSLLLIAIAAAIFLPWAYLLEQRSPEFLKTSFGINVVDRIRRGSEGHSGPPGYYLATIWGTFFPWSLLIPMALVFGWRRRRSHPHLRYALAAFVGPLIMLECVRTKLPHYLLPAFPFLAILTADALVRCFRGEHLDLIRKFFVDVIRGWAFIVALFGFAPWLLVLKYPDQPWIGLVICSAIAIAYGVVVYRYFTARRPRHGIAAMGLGMLILVIALHTVFLPWAGYLHISQRVAEVLRRNDITAAGMVVMQDYKEPSLAFYQGGTIRELSDMSIDPATVPPWLVTTRDVFTRTPENVQARFDIIATVTGLAIADGGRKVEVMVLRKR
jgi:4-amino-4-deoxy-L-arabinose transferase-like glycosyltransferase